MVSSVLLDISNNLCLPGPAFSPHSFFLWNPSVELHASTLQLQRECCTAWLLLTCSGYGSNVSSTPVRISLAKKRKKQKTSTDLPRRLSTMAETGLVGIYQIIYCDRRHTSLLVFSDNSHVLEIMTLQVRKFLSARFKNDLKEVPEQKV